MKLRISAMCFAFALTGCGDGSKSVRRSEQSGDAAIQQPALSTTNHPSQATDPHPNWFDVTTSNGSDLSSCRRYPENCTFRSKVSGLQWASGPIQSRDWMGAKIFCESQIGAKGDGKHNGLTGWRLPAQPELIAAFRDGILTTSGVEGWLTRQELASHFWSGDALDGADGRYWAVFLGNGTSTDQSKSNSYRVICVH